MARSTTYYSRNVQVTLDGRDVTGYWDGDDVVQVERDVDIGTGLTGVDGSFLFSQHASNTARITLRLQHTSPTHRELVQKLKRQKAGAVTAFPFDILDKTSGEGGTADRCYIMQGPAPQKGMAASVRVWTLVTGDWNDTVPNEVI